MASEEDNFDIDIYGDGEDYGQDGAQDNAKSEETIDPSSQQMEAIPEPSSTTIAEQNKEESKSQEEISHDRHDTAQKITSTDQTALDPLQLPKQAPQIQGLTRKDGADNRPVDPGATSALYVSDLHWWINDDDLRGWANQSQCEDELAEITFSEHKVNGKSKGQAYVLFKSPQAATATKQKIESFGEGQHSSKKFTISYTNPYTNPFKTLPKDGPMRNTPASSNRSNSGAYGGVGPGQNQAYNSYRGNRGDGYNNRGAGMNNMSGFNRGGFQQPMAGGYPGSGMGYQGSSMGGMQSYGGFQGRGAMTGGMRGGGMGMRGGRGAMHSNPMMGMPMGAMGMGGMGAMSMGMPQMGGGMGMQGMAGSSSQPHHNSPARHGWPGMSAEASWPRVTQTQQFSPTGASSLSAPISIQGDRTASDNKPSSVWAGYTAYSTTPPGDLNTNPPPYSPSRILVTAPSQLSTTLKQSSSVTGTQTHFNPAFFPQGQQGGTGDANWNPHGAKRTRQE